MQMISGSQEGDQLQSLVVLGSFMFDVLHQFEVTATADSVGTVYTVDKQSRVV